MKIHQRLYQGVSWFNPALPIEQAKATAKFLVLPRSLYKETKKDYAARWPDLFKLIKNEKKLLANGINTVLWMITHTNEERFYVSYAVIHPSVMDRLAFGISWLVPETWLLYGALEEERLYKLDSHQQYWAYLKPNRQLHTTNTSGLMQNPTHFLAALGIQQKNNDIAVFDIKSDLASVMARLPLKSLLGLTVRKAKVVKAAVIDKKRLAKWLTAAMCGYILVTSIGLIGFEHYYTNKVETEKVKADALFKQQESLQVKFDLVNSYSEQINKVSPSSLILMQLTDALANLGEIRSVRVSGNLIQVVGAAPSATEVFAALSNSPVWSEVKFDRPTQRIRDMDSYTISLVFNQAVSGNVNANE